MSIFARSLCANRKLQTKIKRDMRRDAIKLLVERYQNAKNNGQLQTASEATMRTWIDELLSLFDWDVQNTQQVLTEHSLGRAERARLHEIGSTNIRPDYTLVNGNVQLAFVDAKSLSVDIANDRSAAFQIRSYGWSIGAAFSIVTNFEQLAIYDCSAMPSVEDNANFARLYLFNYTEYEEKADYSAKFAKSWRRTFCNIIQLVAPKHLVSTYKPLSTGSFSSGFVNHED